MPRVESRQSIRDRLTKHGQWEAFKARREEIAEKNGGDKRQAHLDTLVEFPPEKYPPAGEPGVGAPVAMPVGGISLSQFAGRPVAKMAEVVRWVFDHLDVRDITAGEAPSPGAWSLLQWARKTWVNRTEFYRTFASKMVAKSDLGDGEEDGKGVVSDLLGTIARLVSVGDAAQSAGAEGSEGELVVSEGGLGGGGEESGDADGSSSDVL